MLLPLLPPGGGYYCHTHAMPLFIIITLRFSTYAMPRHDAVIDAVTRCH